MGRTFDALDDDLGAFIARQHVFFVATASCDPATHVNVSPKGLDTFAVLGPTTVAWLDLTGSGVETIAHLRDDGRVTILFCAFEGPPKILRLYGSGTVIEPADARFTELLARFPAHPGVRSVIVVELDRIADSCGYGVPRMRYEGERTQLTQWAERKGPDGIAAYRRERNARSIDGLRGVES
ncbi:MAG: pyridoxamine 5'-phosphate oxidase family protein [bacterium]|nr:pyridoxamine 5'-phosphate oxidase family protein [bacterium]